MILRPPVLAGLTGGAGTSTLAAALHAREIGRVDGTEPAWLDVLTCRGDTGSLRCALALGSGSPRPRPVLAVVHPHPTPVVAALDLLAALRAEFPAVVLLPDVERWHGRSALGEAAEVLAAPGTALLPELRGYAAGLRLIVAAVMAGGRLIGDGRPPLVAAPRSAERPSTWRPPPRRASSDGPDTHEPDDDTLEAEITTLLTGARAGQLDLAG